MAEETVQQQQEQQAPPSKEQLLAFLQEQIEVKKAQVELQELNTRLAVAKSEEVRALGLLAQMTSPTPPADAVAYQLTEKDIEENPELTEQGFKVGDEVLVPKDSEPAKRKLKK